MPVLSGELPTLPVTFRGFNRQPVIGYYTTGYAGEFRWVSVIIPPAGETILPHPVIGRLRNARNPGTPHSRKSLSNLGSFGCRPVYYNSTTVFNSSGIASLSNPNNLSKARDSPLSALRSSANTSSLKRSLVYLPSSKVTPSLNS